GTAGGESHARAPLRLLEVVGHDGNPGVKVSGPIHQPFASRMRKQTNATRLSALRTAWSRPHRASSAAASGDALSSEGSSRRWFVERMTRSVNGTTAPR